LACPYTSRYSCRMVRPGTIGYGACSRALYIIAERIQDSLIIFHPPVTFRSGALHSIEQRNQSGHTTNLELSICSFGAEENVHPSDQLADVRKLLIILLLYMTVRELYA